MKASLNGVFNLFLIACCLVILAACSTPPAPVEDRSTQRTSVRNVSQLENGVYSVRREDTLYSIAFGFGLDWKDVARWNNIGSPYTIYVGQELRLTSPPASSRTTSPTIDTRPAGTAPRATTRQVDIPGSTTRTEPQATTPAPQETPPRETVPSVQKPVPTPARAPTSSTPATDPTSWLWPTQGRVISTFNASDPSRKGINIAGTQGQDIIASAAGEVVYSGNGLIGFGELIIIKHSDRMLTAYAHNETRLVSEGESVAAGEKIAEMGRNDQEQVMLHFELRVVGKPVNPMQYLPPR